MNKKYIVRLNDQEREELGSIVKKLIGTSQKVRRANVLLKADADGPAWTDAKIADAYHCRIKTVEIATRPTVVENRFGSAKCFRQRTATRPVEN